MKGLMRGLRRDERGLVGKVVQVGPYTVRVDALIGEGGFSSVYRVQDQTTTQMYAMKHARMGGNPEAIENIKNEVEVMKAIRGHPHVLTLRAVVMQGPPGAETEAYLLLDLCTESLVDRLAASHEGRLPEPAALAAFTAVCEAVAIMHAQLPPIAHRDLKAENVLLRLDNTWVLADFGSASRAAGVIEGSVAIMRAEDDIRRSTTPAYRAPEMWDLYAKEPIDYRVDLWALGCLLYLLIYGRLPFAAEAKLQILNGDYSLPEGPSVPVVNLIRDLLQARWGVFEGSGPKVLPDDRPHVDLVLRRLKKIRDAEGSAGAADAQKAAVAPATAVANGAVDPPVRAASVTGKPAHVLYDMDADLELALRLSAEEAEAAERRNAGAAGPLLTAVCAPVGNGVENGAPRQQMGRAASGGPSAAPVAARRAASSGEPSAVARTQHNSDQATSSTGAARRQASQHLPPQPPLEAPALVARPAPAAADDLAGEVEVLQVRLADAATKNKKLLALVHQQHGQIQELELKLYNQAAELKAAKAAAAAARGGSATDLAGDASSWVAFDARGGSSGASEAVTAASGFGSAAFGEGGAQDGGSADGFTPKEAAFGGGTFGRAETGSSAAEGWETVEKDNGVVAAGAASDFESSWDEPEALMGGAAGQSSSAGPAARGSKLKASRDRHGWRL